MLLIAVVFSTAQTNLPNGNFEQWTGNKPTGWDATNFVILSVVVENVFRDTILPAQGTASVRMETKTHNLGIAQPTIPGILTLGTIKIDFTTFSGSVEGGIPFTGRPERLKGLINASPAMGDSAMIAIGFSKWTGNQRDTIGSGLAWYATPHSGWVTFDVPITFATAQQPDSLNIIIASSAVGMQVSVPGSMLYIDSLLFDYGNIMVEVPLRDDGFSVWADNNKRLFIDFNEREGISGKVMVLKADGGIVLSGRYTDSFTGRGIDLSTSSSGVYIVTLISDDGRRYTRKVVLR